MFLVVGRFGSPYYKDCVVYIAKVINDKPSVSTVVGFLRPKVHNDGLKNNPESSAMAARECIESRVSVNTF